MSSLTPEIPVSVGELFDKISILEIKKKYIFAADKIKNVLIEYDLLCRLEVYLKTKDSIVNEYEKLYETNYKLWHLEEEVRQHEKENDFGEDFIIIARSIHSTNDLRSALKKQINLKCKSKIIEEKSY